MKKLLLTISILALLVAPAWGLNTKQAIIQGRTTALATSCTTYIADGQLCYDTDDNVLYVGNGSAAVAVATSTMATDAIWDAKGDLAVGSAANTATKLTIGTAYQLLHVSTDTPGWTSTLGAAGTPLTAGYFTDLTITNAPVVGGVTMTPAADVTGVGDCTGGACLDGSSDGGTNIKLYGTNSHYTEIKAGASAANLTFTFPTAHAAQNLSPLMVSTTGVISPSTYSLPDESTCSEGNILKIDGSKNVTCSDTLGLSTLILPTGTDDPATTSGMILHDTNDTTYSNAGGTVKWLDSDGTKRVRVLIDSGATNYTPIVKTEFLPIAWAVDGGTAPSAIAAVTGKEVNARSFTEGDDVVFWWNVPLDYVGGIKYRVFYALSADASADETVVFSMAGSIVANSGDLDGSAGTALTISDELGTDDDQYQLMVTDYSAASNSDWSLAAGGWARLNFSNAAAGDLTSGEPLVIGIEIKYKAKLLLADQY